MASKEHASRRPAPRPGSLGPNGVANKFLAALIGWPIVVGVGAERVHYGRLLMFDGYSLLIEEDEHTQVLLFKGPGVVVRPGGASPGCPLDIEWARCEACGSMSATGKARD
jgi:hypothetical protein